MTGRKIMIRPSKAATYTVLIFIALLNGCAMQSGLFDIEPNRGGFVITKPPVQMVYRGDFTPESQDFALRALKEMEKIPYQDYKFNENTNVRLNSISGKSDNIDVNMHEVTTQKEEKTVENPAAVTP